MKRTLTALTVAATMFASNAPAFEANTTIEEEHRLLGKPMVGDLAVGVKGLLPFYSFGCVLNGKIHLYSTAALETDPSEYQSYFEIIKQADGEFTATYGPSKNGKKRAAGLTNVPCDKWVGDNPGIIFYPVKSINGFTDRRSFLIDLINKGYE